MTSTPTATNRFLEVLQGFSERKSHKRSRSQAADHIVSVAPTLLYTSVPTTGSAKRAKPPTENEAKMDQDYDVQPQNRNDLSVGDLLDADIQRYQEDSERHTQALAGLEETKKEVLQEIVNVWGIYKYGLTKIAALADLSQAPDAIMPGNF